MFVIPFSFSLFCSIPPLFPSPIRPPFLVRICEESAPQGMQFSLFSFHKTCLLPLQQCTPFPSTELGHCVLSVSSLWEKATHSLSSFFSLRADGLPFSLLSAVIDRLLVFLFLRHLDGPYHTVFLPPLFARFLQSLVLLCDAAAVPFCSILSFHSSFFFYIF